MVTSLDPARLRKAAAAPADPAAEVKFAHLMNCLCPIAGPDERGRFPGSALSRVPPVVIDANRLYQDLRAACKKRRRTVLVNAANSGMIRLFCARHVIEEFYEHAEQWALKAEIDLPVFLVRWEADYLPLLRVVDIPPGLLAPAEAERIALLDHGPAQFRDPDDVPSATLALLLGAYFLSGDRKALRAVYGHDADLTEHKKWLSVLQTGGNAGVLKQMQTRDEETLSFAGRSVFTVLELLWTQVSPIAALLVGCGAVYGYRRLSPATRQRLTDGVTSILDQYAEVAAWCTRETDAFLAVCAPIPDWEQMAETMPADAVLARACLHTIARAGSGDRSAGQLAAVLILLPVPHSETRIRAVLRSSSALHQHARGRFQVGRPAA